MKWFNLARRVLNLTMQLRGKTMELQAAHRRIRDLEQQDRTDERDLIAARARIADLDDRLAQARRSRQVAEAKQKAAQEQSQTLEKQLAEHATKHRIVDLNAQVSTLPPALNRDRANALRLTGENERLRGENEEFRRANARLAVLVDECNTKHGDQHGEGNPS